MSRSVVVCIPTYNAESTILRTLETIIGQSYPIFKIKIFDNQSTDNTIEVIQGFAKRYAFIELVINEQNVGAEGNFTKCMQAAEGDYCLVAHSDDLYEKDFLLNSIHVLEKNSDCVASFCGAWKIDAQEKRIGERLYPSELSSKPVTILNKREVLSLSLKYGNFITCPSVVVRSKIYKDKIKTWNGAKFKTSADLDVWIRLSLLGDLAAIKRPLMSYRVAEVSHSFRVAKIRTTRHDLFLVLDHYRHIYENTLTHADEKNFYFLNLKDQAIRSLNMIREKIKNEPFPKTYAFDLNLVAKRILLSRWHFKMGLAIVGIHIVTSILKLIGWGKPCKE